MQKLINHYSDATRKNTWRNQYVAFRAEHPKHMYYLANRKQPEVCLDLYDQYILEHLVPGTTMAFDAAGYYLEEVVSDLIVVERMDIVKVWYPKCLVTTDPASLTHLHGKINNLIINNTLMLKWKTLEQWTEWWTHNSKLLAPGAQIFCSFRDNRIMRNRLTVNFRSMLTQWLADMEQHGFQVIDYSYDPCVVDDSVTDFRCAGEITDTTNGNLKIHWQYEK